MRPPLSERASGRWKSILPLVGIPASFLTGKHGPCPFCGGKDRWRFIDRNASGTWICSQCGSGDGAELVKRFHRIEFREAAERIEAVIGKAVEIPARKEKPEAVLRAAMRRVWESGKPLTAECVAGKYLASRNLRWDFNCGALRFCDGLAYDRLSRFAAMLAKVTARDGTPVNVLRTYLTADGTKAPVDPVRKLMEGSLPPGSAIRLAKVGTAMGVAEGIETAMSAALLFKLPVWAAVNARNLAKFTPPPGVSALAVFADHDESYTGQAAGFELAKRLVREGIAVTVRMPETMGQDFNDVLRGQLYPECPSLGNYIHDSLV